MKYLDFDKSAYTFEVGSQLINDADPGFEDSQAGFNGSYGYQKVTGLFGSAATNMFISSNSDGIDFGNDFSWSFLIKPTGSSSDTFRVELGKGFAVYKLSGLNRIYVDLDYENANDTHNANYSFNNGWNLVTVQVNYRAMLMFG